MSENEIAFMLEAIDHHYAFKFKSKKGQSFWIVKDVRQLPEGEVGFTRQEFAQLASSHDPEAALLAKCVFRGSTIVHDAVETIGNRANLNDHKKSDPNQPPTPKTPPKKQTSLW